MVRGDAVIEDGRVNSKTVVTRERTHHLGSRHARQLQLPHTTGHNCSDERLFFCPSRPKEPKDYPRRHAISTGYNFARHIIYYWFV